MGSVPNSFGDRSTPLPLLRSHRKRVRPGAMGPFVLGGSGHLSAKLRRGPFSSLGDTAPGRAPGHALFDVQI